MRKLLILIPLTSFLLLAGCIQQEGGTEESNTTVQPDQTVQGPPVFSDLDSELRATIDAVSGGRGLGAFMLPDSADFASIPQDPSNPLTAEKVALGQMIFHDTGFALNGVSSQAQTWSCATCHHSAAGFKSGVLQGIGEGGIGFGVDGSERVLKLGFDATAADGSPNKPDLQPLTSPAVLNAAYQDVMLWNGQFGNTVNGVVNSSLPSSILSPPGTPLENNARRLSGLEIQAIAGAGVHRLNVTQGSPLQNSNEYRNLWYQAYGTWSRDTLEDAGKAIAAYERTILSNAAPFQDWLRGGDAMNDTEKRGAILFFGKAGCAGCHRGPALSTEVGADESSLFAAIGLNDFNPLDPAVAGTVDEKTSLGRGGFTGDSNMNYRFKIPQLYNLADTDVFGHGGSIRSIREIVQYKNRAVAENTASIAYLDPRFSPLGLTDTEVADLTRFLSTGLYDSWLFRYEPNYVPSLKCVVVDSEAYDRDERCWQ